MPATATRTVKLRGRRLVIPSTIPTDAPRVSDRHPICYLGLPKAKAVRVLEAVAEGCQGIVSRNLNLRPGPAVLYGLSRQTLPLWRTIQRNQGEYWYIDNGYFQSKWYGGDYYRVTRNAKQHSGIGDSDGRRLQDLGVQIQPWRAEGRHVLLVVQSDAWYQIHGEASAGIWRDRALREIRRRTDRPVMVREKPMRQSEAKTSVMDDLENCYCVVTYSSNVAVEAICAGVPAISLAPSAAQAMGGSEWNAIRKPPRPDGRQQWAAVLADNQWTVEELRGGALWGWVTR